MGDGRRETGDEIYIQYKRPGGEKREESEGRGEMRKGERG